LRRPVSGARRAGGVTIRGIEAATGARVALSDEAEGAEMREVAVRGAVAAVEMAVAAIAKAVRSRGGFAGARRGVHHAFGLIGAALSKKISVFQSSSLKVVPISPNAW
jgi:hypothetical protein